MKTPSIVKPGILCLALGMLSACGFSGNSKGIHFTEGTYDFLIVDESPPGANKVKLSLVDHNQGKAVKAELTGSGIPYIAIDASSLLGKAVNDLYEMQVTIEVENPSGEFYAVSGDIRAYSGAERTESRDPWSVYLPNKNPNIARAILDREGERFASGFNNFFILTRKVDNALAAHEKPSNLIISEIHFFNEAGKELPVNPRAQFHGPAGFGVPDKSNLLGILEELNIENSEGTSKNWGQAVALDTAKNSGPLDGELLCAGSVVTVYYSSALPPELILQSWTAGAPGSSGWAKVAPQTVNDSNSTAQYIFADMAAAFGSEDFSAWLDKLYIGDTGQELTVYAVTLGRQKE
jgi:hypothetical protein